MRHCSDFFGIGWQAGKQQMQHPVKPVQAGRARTARHPNNRHIPQPSQQQKIAGVNRQAQPGHLPASRLYRSWHYITPVHYS